MTVEPGESELLSVRETARRLGVHENTVRNWAREGILPTARIPGSRFHRFDARDVGRLRRQRGSAVSSVEAERRTIGPELVDGAQLSQWADTRDAQAKFPELVRRLLASTPGVTNVSVRSGEGVSAPGWDGRADSTGTAYLPRGSLYFEFGVSRQPKTKADADYEKRSWNPGGVVAKDSCFIFVTPRRWSNAGAWADARRVEKVFSDVRVLDADDLEGWLQATPAVHHWISEHLGRRPRDAETLEHWWDRFRSRTDPALPAGLFVAGRNRERNLLAEFLGGPPAAIAVKADWRDDAIAFVSATIEAMGKETRNPVQPSLVVSSSDVWNRVVVEPGRMTLLPLFENPDLGVAQEQGHYVILPVGRDQVIRGTNIELPRPARQQAEEALEVAGIDSTRADRLAGLARRSMPSLVRRLARDPRLAHPPWSQSSSATVLAPLVLAGAWTVSEDDVDVVTRMAGEPWPAIERTLVQWARTDDPPFVRSGPQWHLASPEEAFLLLSDALTKGDLERWRQIASEILSEADPRLELAPDYRIMADTKGITRRHSSVLRRGMAEGIALFGALSDERGSNGVSGTLHARSVVLEILNRAASDPSGRLWQSLADVLPLLAEAAPDAFLDAVHDDLDRDRPLLTSMFQDSDQTSGLYSWSPHTGLLWALETLCWSPEFLLEALRALARLQTVDPGGRLSNRPLESLQAVLSGWIRHTAAPLTLKVRAVEQICRQLPDVGWRLLEVLWPTPHAVLSPPAQPQYRDWKPDSPDLPIAEWIDYIAHIVRLAIDLAGSNPERWAQLSERLWPLPLAEQNRLLDALETAADLALQNPEQRLQLWERLHKEVSHHERFATADWSMNGDQLSRMRAIADRLEPTTDVQRYGYLFDWHPDLPDIDRSDYRAYETKLLELRTQAVNDVIERASTEGLRSLALRSPVPAHLGWVAGSVVKDDLAPDLLRWLDSEEPQLRDLAGSWAQRKLADSGVPWLCKSLSRPEMVKPERRLALALRAQAQSDIWDALAQIDPSLSDAYWDHTNARSVTPEDTERAVRELLAHERPWVAVELLALQIPRQADGRTSAQPALVTEVLTAAANADPRGATLQSLGYGVGLLLDFLEAEDADLEVLSSYEFIYFQLLAHHRKPRAFFATLGNDPRLFVDLVSQVYRGKAEPRHHLDAHRAALAQNAWWILRNWRALPGQRGDGTVDDDHLERWVRNARLALTEVDRADIGDEQIGQVLAASPLGADGIWPAEPVRSIIEAIGSPSIEAGIHVGVVNDRGITTRGLYDGGEQERNIAGRYKSWAQQTAGEWPRTSRILRRLAEEYEREAGQHDAEAQVNADTQ